MKTLIDLLCTAVCSLKSLRRIRAPGLFSSALTTTDRKWRPPLVRRQLSAWHVTSWIDSRQCMFAFLDGQNVTFRSKLQAKPSG
jgi:hypothetical protein